MEKDKIPRKVAGSPSFEFPLQRAGKKECPINGNGVRGGCSGEWACIPAIGGIFFILFFSLDLIRLIAYLGVCNSHPTAQRR